MAVRYSGFLSVPQKEVAVIPATSFDVQESYHYGWQARVEVSVESELPIPAGSLLSALAAKGVVPGRQAIVQLATLTEDEEEEHLGVVVRSWPSVVQELQPWREDETSRKITCGIQMADLISHLSDRPIWGAYRAVSLAEIVGGALTLAGGGDGQPTTTPFLPGYLPVFIEDTVRADLHEIPYVVAAGETLGSWLLDLLGRLGVCMELWGIPSGGLRIKLKDNATGVHPIAMQVIPEIPDESQSAEAEVETESTGSATPQAQISAVRGYVSSIQASSGEIIRGGLLDDPVQGAFRRFGNPFGSVGMVTSGPQISFEEADRRFNHGIDHVYVNMLKLQFATRQPGVQPGRRVTMDHTVLNIDEWQVSFAYHRLRGDSYSNVGLLLRADTPWRPPMPAMRSPVIVPGIVNGGDDLYLNEPVERDRLGRIPISFPFLATPLSNELEILAEIDTSQDGKIRLDDFSDEEKEFYESDTGSEEMKSELKIYGDGGMEDPFPTKSDDELVAEDEKDNGTRVEQREALEERRKRVRNYQAYTWAKERAEADTDEDDYITAADSFHTDDSKFAEVLADEDKRAEFEQQMVEYATGQKEMPTDETERGTLLKQFAIYQRWQDAQESKRIAPERWPPRLPLGIAEPMAGGLHGFVSAHRHGDSCRIAVYHPLYAEVIGFEYRGDRRINEGLAGVTAGMVVEHDGSASWSGFVFRRTDQLEEEPAVPDDSDDSDDDDVSGTVVRSNSSGPEQTGSWESIWGSENT